MGQNIAIYKNNRQRPSSDIQTLIKEESVRLRYGAWSQYKMDQVCAQLKEWNIKSLWLNGNKIKCILDQIVSIAFPKLQKIILIDNNIQSIEGLCRIKMPELTRLSLDRNHIAHASQLKKGKWPMLTSITLDDNLIQQVTQFVQGNFSFTIRKLKLEDWSDNAHQYCDLSWLAKWQTSRLSELWIMNQNRINQVKIKSLLKKKYSELQFYEHNE